MIQNPIITISAPRDILVTLVVKNIDSIETLKEFREVREYCKQHNVAFVTREYNSRFYEDDCEHILKLPAFHIHKASNKRWLKTFYFKDEYLEIIHNMLDYTEPPRWSFNIINVLKMFSRKNKNSSSR